MKKVIVVLLAIFPLFLFSQEEIETDRPDQTECASIVPPGLFQLETGIVYSNDYFEKVTTNSFNYATSLFRIGVFKAAELRIEVGQYDKILVLSNEQTNTIEGFVPLVIGTKIAVFDEHGLIPKIAFIGHLELPLGDKKFVKPNEMLPSFRFSLAHTLSEKFSLGYNLGMEWGSGTLKPNYVYTFTLASRLGQKGGAFIETFGSFANQQYPECYFDGGFTYSLFNNIQLDASMGFALNEQSTDLFLSAGISIRLPR